MNQFNQEKRIYRSYEQVWVKKKITKIEWKNWYSKNSSYCFLQTTVGDVWIGFVVAGELPIGCFEMNNSELRQVDDYRRPRGIMPFPLKEIQVDKKKASESTLLELEKMKAKLSNKMSVEPLKVGLEEEAKDNPIQKPEEPISDISEERKALLRQIPF